MADPKYGQYANEISNAKPTKCICPRCGTIHKMRIYWTGNGTPRKFCHSCGILAQHPDFSEFGNYVAGLTIQGRTGQAGIKI